MPKATSAAIVLSDDGTKLLLTRRTIEPFNGQWCIPGGHVEDFEPVRTAIIREVKEETGLDFDPKFFHYFDEIYPDINIHHAVLVFYGKASGTEVYSPEEVSEGRWFTLEEAAEMELAFGHHKVIREFIRIDK